MPFAVHAIVDYDDHLHRVYFSFDAARWGLQDKVEPGYIPAMLMEMAAAVKVMAAALNLLDPRELALQAVARSAAQGLLHEDLQWWHIALIPQFNEHGELVDLLPGLIYLEYVLEDQDPHAH